MSPAPPSRSGTNAVRYPTPTRSARSSCGNVFSRSCTGARSWMRARTSSVSSVRRIRAMPALCHRLGQDDAMPTYAVRYTYDERTDVRDHVPRPSTARTWPRWPSTAPCSAPARSPTATPARCWSSAPRPPRSSTRSSPTTRSSARASSRTPTSAPGTSCSAPGAPEGQSVGPPVVDGRALVAPHLDDARDRGHAEDHDDRTQGHPDGDLRAPTRRARRR